MIFLTFLLLTTAIFIFIARPLTTICHELGHAIPALIITKKKVRVYIGSDGNPRKSLHFKLGLLEIWLRYNPLKISQGACYIKSEGTSINKRIVYILCGPIASLIIASLGCYFAFTYHLHGFIKLTIVLFVASSILDLIINLVPIDKELKLYDGTITYNDGYSLRRLFYYKRISKPYNEGLIFFNAQQYDKASSIFTQLIERNLGDEQLYRLDILCNIYLKKYQKALCVHELFSRKFTLSSDDYANAGLINGYLNLHEESLESYYNALRLNDTSIIALNNIGYQLTTKERYEEAIPYLNKSLSIDPQFSYALNNRGLCYIKTGKEDEGYKDISLALKLDNKNAFCYRNLGIYHLDTNQQEKALELFLKAMELDNDVPLIGELITKAKAMITLKTKVSNATI